MLDALSRAGSALTAVGAGLGRAAAWLLVPIVVAVLTVVIGTIFRQSELMAWSTDLPLLGTHLTLNGIVELQWHLFTVMVLLGGAYAVSRDSHVRVDFVYDNLGPRGQALVNLVGHVVFLIPFCLIVAWLSLDFVELAYKTGEKSDYGGLTDRYLIKAMMPIGFVILALTVLGRVLTHIAVLIDPKLRVERSDAG